MTCMVPSWNPNMDVTVVGPLKIQLDTVITAMHSLRVLVVSFPSLKEAPWLTELSCLLPPVGEATDMTWFSFKKTFCKLHTQTVRTRSKWPQVGDVDL